jgi:hypothetical protein
MGLNKSNSRGAIPEPVDFLARSKRAAYKIKPGMHSHARI